MSPEKAQERGNLTLSFRQLQKFESGDNKISNAFYGLTTGKIEANTEITIVVNLIELNGTRQEEPTTVTCISEDKDVEPEEGKVKQVEFTCKKEDLPEEEYYSFRFLSSDFIAGIPTDEILLDPRLTEEAIKRGELLDYSLKENKDKTPATFTTESVDFGKCETTGDFVIKGTMSEKVEFNTKFEVQLAYPDSASLTCSLDETQTEIHCKVDRTIEDQLIFEQVTIKDGPNEIFVLSSLNEDSAKCTNGAALEAKERLNIGVSFRQVSHFEPKPGMNAFTFFLAGLLNKPMTPGQTITLNIIILINDVKKEKPTTCTLNSDAKEGEQGDFKCESEEIPQEEYKDINFTDPNSISVSPDNEEVAGVNDIDDDQSSPIATDEKIKETEEKNEGELTELDTVLDFSLEENKKIKPPEFTPISIEGSEDCHDKGKLKVKGKFSEDITEELKFELPLSYPKSIVKCKIAQAKKDEEVEVSCKILGRFKKVDKIIIESRLVKNRHKEVVFVNGFSKDNLPEFTCENYNTLRFEKAQKKLTHFDFSFLQIGHFKPGPRKCGFFMALMGPPPQIPITINIVVIVNVGGRLRQLEEKEEETTATCTPKAKGSDAFSADCTADTTGTPSGMELNNDENDGIAGVPSSANPANNDSTDDFSTPEGLNKASNLPKVTISDIEGETCSKDGKFIITAEADKALEKTKYTGVTVPISSPDTSALCDITATGKKLKMECNNKEKFTMSSFLIEQETIKDSEGHAIFTIEPYQSLTQLACEVSTKSVPPSQKSPNETTHEPTPSTINPVGETKGYGNHFSKESSTGLSGGAIAGIIIGVIAAIAIVGILVWLVKGGSFASSKPEANKHLYYESTIQDIKRPNEI